MTLSMTRSIPLATTSASPLILSSESGALPEGFVYVADVCPSIQEDMKYAGPHNFVGRPIVGYDSPRAILTLESATALAQVQIRLEAFGLGLKIYDAYRPQRAAEYFYVWSQDETDQGMKVEFYPAIDKKRVFEEGYLVRHSTHNRGSTVDVTLVPLGSKIPEAWKPGLPIKDGRLPYEARTPDNSLDMGTAFDCLDELSHTFNVSINSQARANRMLLRTLMEDAGFRGISAEWWHFTLKDEPFPETYFDFPIS